jgi:hypothetical protein
MKKFTLCILLLFYLSANAFAYKKEEPKSKTKMVCCESIGYGSKMKKCCESYERMFIENCKLEEGIPAAECGFWTNLFVKKVRIRDLYDFKNN